ncbi:MAG: hypothetical protein V3W14_12565 [Candidatus Neomarinimicrobiota bacterium]
MILDEFKSLEQLAAAIKTLDMVTAIPWTPYQDDSTIVGWSSYTIEQLNYKKIGKLVFVQFRLDGTSDNVAATFTLPFACVAGADFILSIHARDNSGTRAIGVLSLPGGSSTVTLYSTAALATWTASGTKEARRAFFYESA